MFMYKGKLVYTLNDVAELLKEDKNACKYLYKKIKKKYKEKNKGE